MRPQCIRLGPHPGLVSLQEEGNVDTGKASRDGGGETGEMHPQNQGCPGLRQPPQVREEEGSSLLSLQESKALPTP